MRRQKLPLRGDSYCHDHIPSAATAHIRVCTSKQCPYMNPKLKEGSVNRVDRICQFTHFWQILYDEDEVLTLRVLELQLRFFFVEYLGTLYSV